MLTTFDQRLSAWLEWAALLARFPDGTGSRVNLTSNDNKAHLRRLITRFSFVCFIKQKGLLPAWIFDKDAVLRVLNNFDPSSSQSGAYYNGIIQNLFFATMNKKISERAFTDDDNKNSQYGVKTLYRDHKDAPLFSINRKAFVELFNDVPFINSCIFECQDKMEGGVRQRYIDGFSREKDRAAFVPNVLFWGDNAHEGLISLLSCHYFINHEAAIVPAITETLKAYFKQKLEDCGEYTNGEKLDALFVFNDAPHNFNERQSAILLDAVAHCKIFDPACGSGVLLLSVLRQLMLILGKLAPDDAGAYSRKVHLIEHGIYGVDSDLDAIEICKLRFFIALIAEQSVDKSKDNCGIVPLPNLETQFIAANTRVGIPASALAAHIPLIVEKQREVREIRRRYFTAESFKAKMLLRHEDKRVRADITALMEIHGIISPTTAIMLNRWDAASQSAPFFDADWIFGVDGFDIALQPVV
jgi:hypothetical protein